MTASPAMTIRINRNREVNEMHLFDINDSEERALSYV